VTACEMTASARDSLLLLVAAIGVLCFVAGRVCEWAIQHRRANR
jgi:hypothetical protein